MVRVNLPLQATKEDVLGLNGTFMTIGGGYQIDSSWDTSIQLVRPISENADFKGSSLDASQPIRMRTGWKF